MKMGKLIEIFGRHMGLMLFKNIKFIFNYLYKLEIQKTLISICIISYIDEKIHTNFI